MDWVRKHMQGWRGWYHAATVGKAIRGEHFTGRVFYHWEAGEFRTYRGRIWSGEAWTL